MKKLQLTIDLSSSAQRKKDSIKSMFYEFLLKLKIGDRDDASEVWLN